MNPFRFVKDAVAIYRDVRLREKAAPSSLQGVSSYSWMNWWSPVQESFAGAWQRNVTIDNDQTILAFSAVFCCVTGIAADIAKLRIKVNRNVEGIWEEIVDAHGNAGIGPTLSVLRKPNRYQNRIQFVACWIVSKLLYGNTYVLKERERKDGPVVAMYVLDPNRVKVLVAEDGSVYYQLSVDYLSGVTKENPTLRDDNPVVPASEIIHDRMVTLWHPLVGVSPIYACGASATMGNRIQANSTLFFQNMSRPGGQLTAPGPITNETAVRLKALFESSFSGSNIGRIFVGGDGLKFDPIAMPAEVSQLLEQLQWTVQDVSRAFHYPEWKMGGPTPQYAAGPEAVTMMYYTDCLQALIESMELCLDEGLGLSADQCTELDTDNLLRMDTGALFESNNKASDWMKLDEQRKRANLPKMEVGGNTVYKQQQDFSIEALAKRDAQEDPFETSRKPQPQLPAAPAPAVPEPKSMDLETETLELLFEAELRKELTVA